MIKVYTDGGCVLGKKLGYGAIIIHNNTVAEYSDFDSYGGKPTAPRAELLGVLLALKNIPDRKIPVELVTDAKLSINIINTWMHGWEKNGWKKRGKDPVIKNLDIIKEIFALKEGRMLKLTWVKGHSGHKWNERADELASLGAKTFNTYRLDGGPKTQQELPIELVVEEPMIIGKAPIKCELSERLTRTLGQIDFYSNAHRTWASKLISHQYSKGQLTSRQIEVGKDICHKYGKSL